MSTTREVLRFPKEGGTLRMLDFSQDISFGHYTYMKQQATCDIWFLRSPGAGLWKVAAATYPEAERWCHNGGFDGGFSGCKMHWLASFPAFGQFTIYFTAVVDSAPPGTQERNFTAAAATVTSPATPFRTISPSLPLKEGMRRQRKTMIIWIFFLTRTQFDTPQQSVHWHNVTRIS